MIRTYGKQQCHPSKEAAITGRHEDLIFRGGENLYPREIEVVSYPMEGIVLTFYKDLARSSKRHHI
jgi:acyl-CoA synthetase (AMP-forming)/AMP-acid ligase II